MYEGRHDYGWPNPHLQTGDPEDRDTPGGNYRSGSLQRPADIEPVFADFAEDLIPGEPGDAFFFDNYVWHRGEPNLGEVNRAAYANGAPQE